MQVLQSCVPNFLYACVPIFTILLFFCLEPKKNQLSRMQPRYLAEHFDYSMFGLFINFNFVNKNYLEFVVHVPFNLENLSNLHNLYFPSHFQLPHSPLSFAISPLSHHSLLRFKLRVAKVVVSCPTRWSLYLPLALCIDHLSILSTERRGTAMY